MSTSFRPEDSDITEIIYKKMINYNKYNYLTKDQVIDSLNKFLKNNKIYLNIKNNYLKNNIKLPDLRVKNKCRNNLFNFLDYYELKYYPVFTNNDEIIICSNLIINEKQLFENVTRELHIYSKLLSKGNKLKENNVKYFYDIVYDSCLISNQFHFNKNNTFRKSDAKVCSDYLLKHRFYGLYFTMPYDIFLKELPNNFN